MKGTTEAQKKPAVGRTMSSTVKVVAPQERSYWKLVRQKFFRHRLAVGGLIILLLLALGAVFANEITPYDPYRIDMRARIQPPSMQHLMGTDDLGRDELARAMLGGRVSLSVGLLAVVVALVVGASIGSIAGYYGGAIDNVLMRFTDVIFAFPAMILAMIFVALLGQTLSSLALVIGVVSWMGIARLVRAAFLSLKEEEFITAARCVGVGNVRIILRHILPNAFGPIIVAATLGVARAIIMESGLSYLGLGIQAPVPSWGGMLYFAQNQLDTASWLSIFPGLMIFIAVLSINFVGDGLRDAMDPRHLLR